ncbi:TPA: YceK/YidQ family lipoprotein [Pseudomonas putida]
MVDMAASCIADTVVLPYTSYKQYKYGNMVIPSFSLQMHQEPAQSGGSK